MRTGGERRFDPGPCEERDSPYSIQRVEAGRAPKWVIPELLTQ
jgi:hypothetical protein